MRRTLIEEESFDLIRLFHLVGNEAKIEKNAIPPINEMLYWWTRKPLIVARAVALASSLNDIHTVKFLLGIGNEKRAYRYIPSMEIFKKNIGKDPSEISVIDPFGGAGNLIFEAKRLGLMCEAMDYNPVAYLLMKSVLEYSCKYGSHLAEDVDKYGKILIERTRAELGKFFVRTNGKPLVYLWVWCIKCPYCNQRIPLANQMWILKKDKKKIAIKVTPQSDLNFKVELIQNADEKDGNQFTQKKGKAICIKCRNSIDNEQLTTDIAKNKDKEMIIVVIQNSNGKEYHLPTDEDKRNYKDSTNYLNEKWVYYKEQGLIPDEDIRPSRENTLWNYGIKKWYQFFNERQLLVMLTILKNIKDISNNIDDKEYAGTISVLLSFLLCKHVNCNSIGVVWNKGAEKVEHALLTRRPSLVYNFTEINPFEKGRGVLKGVLENIVGAITFASLNKNYVKVSFGSVLNLATKNEKKFDLVITDPPYMDDVQYAELSDFFYVWIYRAVKDFYPELPPAAPINEDISVSLWRFGDRQLANDFYKKAMKEAFKQIYKSLKDDGILVLFFAHSSTQAWNLLLEVLREARLMVGSSYAIHTENPSNVIAIGKTSFMSSIIISCRKIVKDSTSYFEDTIPKIEDKIKYLLKNLSLEELLDLPMTDLLIMTYGKVLEETTQHTTLKSYRADFKPEFENLIKDAREFILKEIVIKITGRSPNVLGSDMSFYIVTKVFYKGILDSNEALKIAWAYQINVGDLVAKQVLKKEGGLSKLLFFDEIWLEMKPDEIDKNNLHQQLLYLEYNANKKGVSGVKSIVSFSNNFRIHDLTQIINLLIKSYRTRINRSEILSGKEQKEMKILESLADIFNSTISPSRNTLEKFMG